jgi:hypothetical protein
VGGVDGIGLDADFDGALFCVLGLRSPRGSMSASPPMTREATPAGREKDEDSANVRQFHDEDSMDLVWAIVPDVGGAVRGTPGLNEPVSQLGDAVGDDVCGQVEWQKVMILPGLFMLPLLARQSRLAWLPI